MKNILILVSCILLTFNTYAQHKLGLTANVGASRVSNSLTNTTNGTLDVKWGPSGHLGVFYQFQISKHSSLGTELLFMQIEGRETYEWKLYDDNQTQQGNAIHHYYNHYSFLSLPIYYGYRVNNFTFNLGFQVSYLFSSSYRDTGESTYQGETQYWDDKYSSEQEGEFNLGIRLGLSYHFYDRLSLETTYYYGTNDIQSNTITWFRAQQVTIGIKYAFISNTKE